MFSVRALKKGFTLVELMIVIAVMAILSALAFFGLRQAQGSARDVSRIQVMTSIRGQLERYYGDNNKYPQNVGFRDMLTAIGYTTLNLTDPGCGGGTRDYTSGVGTWTPAPIGGCTYTNTVNYIYSTTGNSNYTLTLNKEGGGTSAWSNPQ